MTDAAIVPKSHLRNKLIGCCIFSLCIDAPDQSEDDSIRNAVASAGKTLHFFRPAKMDWEHIYLVSGVMFPRTIMIEAEGRSNSSAAVTFLFSRPGGPSGCAKPPPLSITGSSGDSG